MAVGLPLLETLGTDDQKASWLQSAASGDTKIAVVFDGDSVTPHAGVADVVLVQHGDHAYCVPQSDLGTSEEVSVDRARNVARVQSDALSEAFQMRSDVDGHAAFASAREHGAVATAAQLVGLSLIHI